MQQFALINKVKGFMLSPEGQILSVDMSNVAVLRKYSFAMFASKEAAQSMCSRFKSPKFEIIEVN